MTGARYRSGRNPWPWITREHRTRARRWATVAGVVTAVGLLAVVWSLAGPAYAAWTAGVAAVLWRIAR